MIDRYLVDTGVFLYARGRDHRYRDPCRRLVAHARDGGIGLVASVELLQEFTHVLLRRDEPPAEVLAQADEIAATCELVPLDVTVWTRASSLLASTPDLGVRDAVHAATALHAGRLPVCSTDKAFDRVGGIVRQDPADADADWNRT